MCGNMTKEPNLFDYLEQISSKSTKLKYDKKNSSAYMISLWLSHDPRLLNLVQKINHLQFVLPDDIIYNYYFNEVPKMKKRFIKWIKKTPESKKRDKKVKELMEENSRLSKREAKSILQFYYGRKP